MQHKYTEEFELTDEGFIYTFNLKVTSKVGLNREAFRELFWNQIEAGISSSQVTPDP